MLSLGTAFPVGVEKHYSCIANASIYGKEVRPKYDYKCLGNVSGFPFPAVDITLPWLGWQYIGRIERPQRIWHCVRTFSRLFARRCRRLRGPSNVSRRFLGTRAGVRLQSASTRVPIEGDCEIAKHSYCLPNYRLRTASFSFVGPGKRVRNRWCAVFQALSCRRAVCSVLCGLYPLRQWSTAILHYIRVSLYHCLVTLLALCVCLLAERPSRRLASAGSVAGS